MDYQDVNKEVLMTKPENDSVRGTHNQLVSVNGNKFYVPVNGANAIVGKEQYHSSYIPKYVSDVMKNAGMDVATKEAVDE